MLSHTVGKITTNWRIQNYIFTEPFEAKQITIFEFSSENFNFLTFGAKNIISQHFSAKKIIITKQFWKSRYPKSVQFLYAQWSCHFSHFVCRCFDHFAMVIRTTVYDRLMLYTVCRIFYALHKWSSMFKEEFWI